MAKYVCTCECEVIVEAEDEGKAEDNAIMCVEEGFSDCEVNCDCSCTPEEE